MMAPVVRRNMRALLRLSYAHLDKSDFVELKTIACILFRKYGFHDASGHHDLARS